MPARLPHAPNPSRPVKEAAQPVRVNLVELLQLLAREKGTDFVKALAGSALKQAARQAGFSDVDDFLDQYRVRPRWRRALNWQDGSAFAGPQVNAHELAHCLRVLQVPLDALIQTLPRPWDQWRTGAELAIILGKKRVRVRQGRTRMRLQNYSERDADSLFQLISLLHTSLGLRFRPKWYEARHQFSPAEATELLEELRDRKDVGAVLAVGSPVVNSVTDPMARLMFGDFAPAELPARFRFANAVHRTAPFLCDGPCRPEEEGIRYQGMKRTTFPRVPVEEIFRRVRQGERGPFPDCGLLLVDCRGRCPLIICAGHGGCGTEAAILALAECSRVHMGLNEDDTVVGRDRVFEVVTVQRTKRTRAETDDLEFNRVRGKGWDFTER